MSGPGSVILVCVSMVLAVGAFIFAWESARKVRKARERVAATYAEIDRLREGR